MIDTVLNLLFRCPHRRLTRPVTPVSKPGVASGETYVVCLDCGKQFTYDWDRMRIGRPIEKSAAAGVLHPDMPKRRNTGIRYALLGSAIPMAVLLGNALRKNAKKKKGESAPREREVRREPAAPASQEPKGGAQGA